MAEIDWDNVNVDSLLSSLGEGNVDAELRAKNKAADDERLGYTVGPSPAAGTAFLNEKGFSSTARQRNTEEVYRQTKRAMAQTEEMYRPFWGLQFQADAGALRGLANLFHEKGIELTKLREKVGEFAQADLDEAAKVAMNLVEVDRKRKGWAARAEYTDRKGRHHLQNAIWESRVIRQAGNEFSFIGFDYQILNDLTMPGRKSGRGYWLEYEEGSRGGFIMPRGIWVGPSGEGNRKGIKGLATAGTAGHGEDRFYPTKNGRANTDAAARKWAKNKGRGPGGVYAHQAANPVLQIAIESMATKIGFQLGHLFADDPHVMNAINNDTHGESNSLGYSTTATMEDLNR